MLAKRKSYTKEFKIEAVRLMEEGNRSVSQLARELEISGATLHTWRKQLKQQGDHAFPGKGSLTPEQAELSQLRLENRQLRQERDLFKKVLTYFSKES